MESVQDSVKEYYGKILTNKKDLKTTMCTVGKFKMPKHVRDALKEVHEEITSKFYGCGTVIPECLQGMSVLDLGCGSGQDCYILSKLVGESGNVVGLDMTDEQLETARAYIAYHTELYGYSKPNVHFVKGYIEKLADAGLEENSFDLIVSNCVVNLSPDKRAVLEEAYRVLKVGGEMYFSDAYADRDLPEQIRKHEVLWGECVAGALWWEDVGTLAEEIGFAAPRIVSSTIYNLGNKELEEVLGDAKFASVTYRLFKPPKESQPACKVIYKGTVRGYEDQLVLDHHHIFKTGEAVPVDAELATLLQASRFSGDFTFQPCTEQTISTSQKMEMNPFKIAEALGDSGAPGSCGSSCDTGCGPPKAESACGPSKAKSACVPSKAKSACGPSKAKSACGPSTCSGGSCS